MDLPDGGDPQCVGGAGLAERHAGSHHDFCPVPGEAFGAPGYLRLSYALSDDEMVESVRRLGELFATAV